MKTTQFKWLSALIVLGGVANVIFATGCQKAAPPTGPVIEAPETEEYVEGEEALYNE